MSKPKRSALGATPDEFPDLLGAVVDPATKPKRTPKAQKVPPELEPMRTTLILPGELHKRLKVAAAQGGTTVTALLIEGAELVLRPE